MVSCATCIRGFFAQTKIFFSKFFETKIQKISLWLSCKKSVSKFLQIYFNWKKIFFENFDFCEIRSDINVGVGKSLLQSVQKCFFFSLKNKTKILTQKTVIILHAVYFKLKYDSSLQFRYENLKNHIMISS